MPGETRSSSPTRCCRVLATASRWFWVLAVVRLAIRDGSRLPPGYSWRRKLVPCPTCGKKVRLQADGWAYCTVCHAEFEYTGK